MPSVLCVIKHHYFGRTNNIESGDVQSTLLALERGWSVNLGGGFHHCSSSRGGGFCAYADVTLAIRLVRQHDREVNRVMIVDLDASQVCMLIICSVCSFVCLLCFDTVAWASGRASGL